MKCCICGCQINSYGNNPFPLCKEEDYESRCCDCCNDYVVNARILNLRNKKSIEEVELGDTIVILFTDKSDIHKEYLVDNGKFLAGIVEEIKTENNKIQLIGSWGNFTIDSEDNFLVV